MAWIPTKVIKHVLKKITAKFKAIFRTGETYLRGLLPCMRQYENTVEKYQFCN